MPVPRLATRSRATRRALANRQPFVTYGAFHAACGEPASRGRLPDAWWDLIRGDHYGRIRYTVYSYVTPIAWVLDDDTVVIPPVRYSITTSGHQGLLYALTESPHAFPDDTDRAWVPTQPPGAWEWPRAPQAADEPTTTVPRPGSWYARADTPHPAVPVPVPVPTLAAEGPSPADTVLDRIRAALAEADAQPPQKLHFEGPATLLDAPDLAYSEQWCTALSGS